MAAKKKAAESAGVADLRAMSVEDLRAQLVKQQQEVFDMRFRHATAQLEKTSELKSAKRQVARIMTILKEKE
ncbi:MAG: 50S ribosomal protein L29 [Desulfovibrionaceae bacterium]|nr:50S ribosomal protein L29 [Desulfovibrionaceae bacterium]